MKNTVVGVVITLNDIICKPVTTHGQGEVIIEYAAYYQKAKFSSTTHVQWCNNGYMVNNNMKFSAMPRNYAIGLNQNFFCNAYFLLKHFFPLNPCISKNYAMLQKTENQI